MQKFLLILFASLFLNACQKNDADQADAQKHFGARIQSAPIGALSSIGPRAPIGMKLAQ